MKGSRSLLVTLFLCFLFGAWAFIAWMSLLSPIPIATHGVAIGELHGSEVIARGKNNAKRFKKYALEVSYSFSVDNVEFKKSDTQSFGQSSDPDELLSKFESYRSDLNGRCFIIFDRSYPERSIVYVPKSNTLELWALVVAVMGVTFLLSFWIFRKRTLSVPN